MGDLKKKGFTLIELMVVLLVMTLIFGLGSASYREFTKRQSLRGAARTLKADLRLAQQFAISGKKPAGCGVLDGYEFFFDYSVSSPLDQRYSISPRCSGVAMASVKTVDIPDNVSILVSPPFPDVNPILFKVLGQGTNIPEGTSEVIRIGLSGHLQPAAKLSPSLWEEEVVITITAGGEIY